MHGRMLELTNKLKTYTNWIFNFHSLLLPQICDLTYYASAGVLLIANHFSNSCTTRKYIVSPSFLSFEFCLKDWVTSFAISVCVFNLFPYVWQVVLLRARTFALPFMHQQETWQFNTSEVVLHGWSLQCSSAEIFLSRSQEIIQEDEKLEPDWKPESKVGNHLNTEDFSVSIILILLSSS